MVKFSVAPEHVGGGPDRVADFTGRTRAEPGNLCFEWSRSLATPDQYVLVEAFRDDAAGAHVDSAHVAAGLEAMRPALPRTPEIVNFQVPGTSWSEMGELKVSACLRLDPETAQV